MSLATSLGKFAQRIPQILRSPAGQVGTAVAGSVALDAAVRGVLPGVGGGAVPRGYHLAKDGSGRVVRNRRMNYGNARAARRAIRRIKGARKLLQDIEKQMPRRAVRARAPAGHASHLTHK